MDTDSEDAFEDAPLPRPRIVRVNKTRSRTLKSSEKPTEPEPNFSKTTNKIKRRELPEIPVETVNNKILKVKSPKTYGINTKRPKRTDIPLKITSNRDLGCTPNFTKKKFVLDCVELFTEKQYSPESSRSDDGLAPIGNVSHIFNRSKARQSRKSSEQRTSVPHSPSIDLPQPFIPDESSQKPDPGIGEKETRTVENSKDSSEFSRNQKRVITLDSQDSTTDDSGEEWEEERIRFLKIFSGLETALFQADTLQSFMESKSQLARSQRVYNSASANRKVDELSQIIGEYTGKSLETISYFEDQIILLRMDLAKKLKILVQERERKLQPFLSSQPDASCNSMVSPKQDIGEPDSLPLDEIHPFYESSPCNLSKIQGSSFDDLDTDMILSGVGEIPMLKTQESPQRQDIIDLEPQKLRNPQRSTSPAMDVEPSQKSPKTINSSSSIRLSLLPTDSTKEEALKFIESPHTTYKSAITTRTPSPLPPLSWNLNDELEKLNNQDIESSCRSDATTYDLDLRTPPPLPPLRTELSDGYLYSYEGLSRSPSPVLLSHPDEDFGDVSIFTPEKSNDPLLTYQSPAPLDHDENHEPLENQLSGMRISQEPHSLTLDEDDNFDCYSRKTVSPWRDLTPRARLSTNYENRYERPLDQHSDNDHEADLLEYDLIDVEPPGTLYYMPSPSPPHVASTMNIEFERYSPQKPIRTALERPISSSQPAFRPPKSTKVSSTQPVSKPMPDYKSMSLDTLKDHAKVYGLRVNSSRTLISQLEHIWKNLYDTPSTENSTLTLSQPTLKSRNSTTQPLNRSKPTSSLRVASRASSTSEMDTDDDENDLDGSIWDLTETDTTEIEVTSNESPLEEVFFNFIKNDTQLYNSILCYKPVDFEKLYEDITQAGHIFKRHTLRDFLDNRVFHSSDTKISWK
ncbi:hypothetical protein K7432_007368 [Basidiobolus ranarum]|uniref:Structure-specific endonuclease subunit SLX4 n=1 Tax=Basidiobolus ranarum TaxID=34480 RepID=A0ABR2WTH3_9FUNG